MIIGILGLIAREIPEAERGIRDVENQSNPTGATT